MVWVWSSCFHLREFRIRCCSSWQWQARGFYRSESAIPIGYCTTDPQLSCLLLFYICISVFVRVSCSRFKWYLCKCMKLMIQYWYGYSCPFQEDKSLSMVTLEAIIQPERQLANLSFNGSSTDRSMERRLIGVLRIGKKN